MKKKEKIFLGGMLALTIILISGVSFALWSMTLQQTTENVITTGCFKIEFSDINPINLASASPITDEEGKSLVPYTFTITNTCDSYATYQINLEILNTTTLNRLEFVKNSLNEKEPSVLTNFDTVQATLENATTSKKLETGFLDKLESKTFTLRLWLDEDTPAIPEVMNKTIESKVTIISSLLPESPSYAEVITNCSNNGYRTADCMLENSKYDTVNLAYDRTTDNNLRYIGASPNNYILFNNELWRIIGVMNNVEDSEGNTGSRLKLIRNEPIGNYSWDTSASNINFGNGVNEWSEADLMKLLNPGFEKETIGGSLYWNRASGTCYNGKDNATTSCNFTNTGLLDDTKNMIEKVIWNTGSNVAASVEPDILTNQFYELERSNNIGRACTNSTDCNDTVPRTTKWTGFVGLMYPSDYGYATNGGNTTDRVACLNIVLRNWYTVNDCYSNNWLYKENLNQRTITPFAMLTATDTAFNVYSHGSVFGGDAIKFPYSVEPTIFLKENASLMSGNGTIVDPFELSAQ